VPSDDVCQQAHNETWMHPDDVCIRHYCKDGSVATINQRQLCTCGPVYTLTRHTCSLD